MELSRKPVSTGWYQRDTGATFQELGTGEKGLAGSEVARRLSRHGPNSFGEEGGPGVFTLFAAQFKNPLIFILLIAATITGLLHEYIDMAVILSVVGFNAVVGFVQEYRAERSARALKQMVVPRARVLRDGKEQEVRSEELVPGDVVLLTSGSKVPADLRLFTATELRADESLLTGESVPAHKTTDAIPEGSLTPGDQRNMAFMGTYVASGRGRGVVVETGRRTVLGDIARKVVEIHEEKTPLQRKFERLARQIGLIVLSASVVLFLLGMAQGYQMETMFLTVVAVAVATIPEGLPIVVTIAMSRGVSRMAGRNAIVRKLPAVEALGSTTIICSDKTGTLTKNEMTVRLLYDGNNRYEVTGTGYDPAGAILHGGIGVGGRESRDLEMLLRTGLLCNESGLVEGEGGQYAADGDPTEVALVVSAMKGGMSRDEELGRMPLLATLPFESDHGYMATLHRNGERNTILVKGAPEKVVEMCGSCATRGAAGPEEVQRVSETFAAEGLRVLAFAYRDVPADTSGVTHDDLRCGLVFAGLQGMIDPPRPEAIRAVESCRSAGIKVAMITGDHATTAVSVARRLGIIGKGEEERVLSGREIEMMSDSALAGRVADVRVYARVSPDHKLRIVEQYIAQGEIVAVTGDGVNDAPALKKAHVGVSMGKGGTDVAKEASDVILTDDNFASIFGAVEEGRIVYDNIRKATFFLIPTGIAAVISIAVALALNMPVPFIAVQLLWINLVTNGMQDVALAFEPGEKDVLTRPPRDPDESIMSPMMVQRTILVSSLIAAGVMLNFSRSIDSGATPERAQTVAMTSMVFFQFFQAWNSRSEKTSIFGLSPLSNPFLFFSLIGAFFAQLAVMYVPFLQFIFGTAPPTLQEWGLIAATSVTVVALIELDKHLRSRGLMEST